MSEFTPRPYRCRPLEDRFWEKVNKGSGECWEWTGAKDTGGYGLFRTETRKSMVKAHRVSWTITKGVIPDGLYVLHKCDNRICVRPDHLFIGTHMDNMNDASAKGKWYGRNHAVGSQLPQAKLKASDIPTIRQMSASGERTTVIAEKFGVSFGAIKLIIDGKNWKSVQ